MRYYHYFILLLFLFSSSVLNAQEDLSIRKKDFKTGKSGFNEAWKHIANGDSYFSEGGIWYGYAFDEYIQAIVYNNSNPQLNYKTGVSALYSDNREDAAGFLLKSLEVKNDVAEDVLLLAGRALQYGGRYSEAVQKYNDYLVAPWKKSKEKIALANKCIEECNSAIIITKDTLRIVLDNMGANINSGTDDYSEVFTPDGQTLYFGSRRELPKSGRRKSDTKFDENIFISHQNIGFWDPAITAGKEITTTMCETPLYISSDPVRLYTYAGYENGGDIKMSVFKKGKWKTPERLPFKINSKGSETSFCFSPSGNEIYYVSDNGKVNMGGKDIYFIRKLNARKWSKPVNAGRLINTVYDEESVRFSKTGDTIWFSSEGHNSIGGFDIFYSVRNQSGEWDSVKNCGYPVNTQWDELFYYPSPVEDSLFYFVSNRSGGFGGLDIYSGRIMPPETIVAAIPPPEPVIIRDTVVIVKEVEAPLVTKPEPVEELILYLTGTIKDSETGEPVLAKVDVLDINTNEVLATTASSDLDGGYRVRLPAKTSYMVDLRATGFLSDMKRIAIPDNYQKDLFNLDATLIKVKVGKRVVLNNILFETGKSVLTQGSYAELDHLLNIMNENALMKIEISGHTDKTGSEQINFKLSENRAKAVVDYLAGKGIDRSRIESKGYGSLQPVDDNATSQGRARNRRVEFKILEF